MGTNNEVGKGDFRTNVFPLPGVGVPLLAVEHTNTARPIVLLRGSGKVSTTSTILQCRSILSHRRKQFYSAAVSKYLEYTHDKVSLNGDIISGGALGPTAGFAIHKQGCPMRRPDDVRDDGTSPSAIGGPPWWSPHTHVPVQSNLIL